MARPRAIPGAFPQKECNQPPEAGDWIACDAEREAATITRRTGGPITHSSKDFFGRGMR